MRAERDWKRNQEQAFRYGMWPSTLDFVVDCGRLRKVGLERQKRVHGCHRANDAPAFEVHVERIGTSANPCNEKAAQAHTRERGCVRRASGPQRPGPRG